MSKFWTKSSLAFLLLFFLFLAACSSDDNSNTSNAEDANTDEETEESTENEEEAKFGGELVVGMTADPDTLNPLVSNTTPGNWINSAIYPHLMMMNPEQTKVPYIAESVDVSDDGLEVTFTLREGLTWQDGEPITSEDVKFTGELLHEHQLQWTAEIFNMVESVETPDDLTVTYKLSEPYPAFPGAIGYWVRIVPKHIWEEVEDPASFSNSDPVGAGPFKLANWEKGQYVELEAVDEWFAAPEGKPYLDKVTFRIYPDINTMVLALQSGEIDVTAQDIPTSTISQFEDDEKFEVVKTPSLGYAYFSFMLNPDEPSPTEDKNFRLAMATATDRESIINVALEGSAMNIDTPLSPIYSDWVNPDAKAPEYDLEKAAQILTDAGYEDTDSDGVLNAPEEFGGENVVLDLTYDAANSFHQKVARILQSNAEEIGVSLNLDAVEYNTLSAKVMTEHDFDMHIGKWGAFDEPSETFNNLFNSEAALNFMELNDPTIDELGEGANYAASEEEARDYVMQAQEWFVEEFPVVPIYVQEFNLVYNQEKFDGFEVYPSDLQGLVDPSSLIQVYQK